METYTKINSPLRPGGVSDETTVNEIDIPDTAKESFEPLTSKDPAEEESIFEVFKAKEYTEMVSGIIKSIDNYYQDVDCYDDYPYFRIQNTCKFIPTLDETSEILSERQLRELHSHLHYYHQYKNLKLVYSTSKHGISLKTFYMRAEGVKNSILILKDDNQNVFGAYLSDELKIYNSFYGTGETFLFTFYKTDRIHVFQSTGKNDYYMYSDEHQICFGCSDNYFSLCLQKEFLAGYSKPTQTFKNPPLSSHDNFFISNLELWTFQDQTR